MRPTARSRNGSTLIEIVVVLAILSTMSGVVIGWMTSTETASTNAHAERRTIAAALEMASREGRSISVTFHHEGEVHTVTALPGGRLLGGEVVDADPMTGAWVK
jgi:type II secretory pathway pseudopilin PulG